ncbi:unnamed protein product [Protopolystoma xenopodis]|uniref:Uncharacterized protein n=1 Tax=Protopolystoma xenopodis TaxID=117903 RepID=A0A3S4ZY97_9PLAT|nr:unnamed protein product [Protopolystoma xenopodis]
MVSRNRLWIATNHCGLICNKTERINCPAEPNSLTSASSSFGQFNAFISEDSHLLHAVPTSRQSTNVLSARASQTLPVSTPFLQTNQTPDLLRGTTVSELCGRDRAVLPRGTTCSGPGGECESSCWGPTGSNNSSLAQGLVDHRLESTMAGRVSSRAFVPSLSLIRT